MPTYVYGCDACGHRFEKSQKFSDEPVRICPECQSSVRRILQPAGIVFKGSGWHTTDYKRSNGNGGESSNGDAKGTADGAAKSEAKAAEPKAETTSEAASAKSDTAPSAPPAS